MSSLRLHILLLGTKQLQISQSCWGGGILNGGSSTEPMLPAPEHLAQPIPVHSAAHARLAPHHCPLLARISPRWGAAMGAVGGIS